MYRIQDFNYIHYNLNNFKIKIDRKSKFSQNINNVLNKLNRSSKKKKKN